MSSPVLQKADFVNDGFRSRMVPDATARACGARACGSRMPRLLKQQCHLLQDDDAVRQKCLASEFGSFPSEVDKCVCINFTLVCILQQSQLCVSIRHRQSYGAILSILRRMQPSKPLQISEAFPPFRTSVEHTSIPFWPGCFRILVQGGLQLE